MELSDDAMTGERPLEIHSKKIVKKVMLIGFKVLLPLVLDKSVNGKTNKINKDANIANTPKSLFGIDLKIA